MKTIAQIIGGAQGLLDISLRYFDIEKTSNMITRLKAEPNLRLLCGFEKAPDKSQFSRGFAYIAGLKIMDTVSGGI